jgi:glyoxylase-like metal-dependent hydrolase (beta-lactamase superfamily II)
MIYGVLQSWLIEADGLRILFDTGAGNGKSRPALPIFGDMNTNFLGSLESGGVCASSIDLVVCSHLHIDHVGWNTVLKDVRWVPTFSNAKYVFPAVDRDVWDPAGEIYATMNGAAINANVFEDSVQPILDAGLADLVTDGHELTPGLILRAAPGHTPGHMLLDARAGADRALFTADIFHHPMEMIRPDWNSVFCENPTQASATRRAVLEDAAATQARIVPAHFAGTHSTFVTRDGHGYRPAGVGG